LEPYGNPLPRQALWRDPLDNGLIPTQNSALHSQSGRGFEASGGAKMSEPKCRPRLLLELSLENLKRLYSLFDAIERTVRNLKVARELCRSGRSLLSTRTAFREHEISAAEFQDLLRRLAERERDDLAKREKDATAIAM
jgi:hypothetical protein